MEVSQQNACWRSMGISTRLQHSAGKEVSPCSVFVVLFCLCARNGQWRREAIGSPMVEWKRVRKTHWEGSGWMSVSDMGDSSRRSEVEKPLHYGFRLQLIWKNPPAWAKCQGRKYCGYSLHWRIWCSSARVIVVPSSFRYWGTSLLYVLRLLPSKHSKEEDKGYWYIPPDLLLLWNQITVGCPPHLTWVNISCMENNIRGLAMQWMLHGQVMLQWGQPYILFMYFRLARLHFYRDCGHKWGDNLPFRCNLWKENLLHFLEFVRKWLCVNWQDICQTKCSLWRSFLAACILKNTAAHKWSG